MYMNIAWGFIEIDMGHLGIKIYRYWHQHLSINKDIHLIRYIILLSPQTLIIDISVVIDFAY